MAVPLTFFNPLCAPLSSLWLHNTFLFHHRDTQRFFTRTVIRPDPLTLTPSFILKQSLIHGIIQVYCSITHPSGAPTPNRAATQTSYLEEVRMNKKVTYWIELSDYDIETAAAMLISKRYLYVGFMAHQAIEKILKAYFVKSNKETAPFSHSLSYIAKQSENFDLFSEEQKDLIDMLEPLNIEARYPSHKKQLF